MTSTLNPTISDAGQNTDNGSLSCRSRVKDNSEYAAFARRMVRAYARRVAAGDVEALPALVALADELERATETAVRGLHAFGYSWTEIADRLGVTRQAARQRWAEKS
jgi:DNA-directed RNA polymerase specialized sigma24 family protein